MLSIHLITIGGFYNLSGRRIGWFRGFGLGCLRRRVGLHCQLQLRQHLNDSC